MQYRKDKYGNPISVLGYGCMRFTQKAGRIDIDKAEREILAGSVTVNGLPASLGMKVTPGEDRVAVRGKPVLWRESSGDRPHTYILLNKPVGYVTTMSD